MLGKVDLGILVIVIGTIIACPLLTYLLILVLKAVK